MVKVDLYEFFYPVLFIDLCYYIMNILTPIYHRTDLWHLSHQGKGVQELFSKSIGSRKGKVFI